MTAHGHAIDPWRGDTQWRLAQLLWSAGRPDEALEAALKGLDFDPPLLPLRKWLAESYRQLGRTADADREESDDPADAGAVKLSTQGE